MIRAELNSHVPVIGYVSPSGARAASEAVAGRTSIVSTLIPRALSFNLRGGSGVYPPVAGTRRSVPSPLTGEGRVRVNLLCAVSS